MYVIIQQCGRIRWSIPAADLLSDRRLKGEGCINIREISGRVDANTPQPAP